MRALVLSEKPPELLRKTSALTRLVANAGAATGLSAIPEVVRQVSRVWLPLGQQITILGAELVGLELAEFLAERGRDVTVIDSTPQAGKGMQTYTIGDCNGVSYIEGAMESAAELVAKLD